MSCYKPHEWDKLDPAVIEWLYEHGMSPILDEMVCNVNRVWEMIIENDFEGKDDFSNPAYLTILTLTNVAFGMYNAMLIMMPHDLACKLYDWGHYSVFY